MSPRDITHRLLVDSIPLALVPAVEALICVDPRFSTEHGNRLRMALRHRAPCHLDDPTAAAALTLAGWARAGVGLLVPGTPTVHAVHALDEVEPLGWELCVGFVDALA